MRWEIDKFSNIRGRGSGVFHQRKWLLQNWLGIPLKTSKKMRAECSLHVCQRKEKSLGSCDQSKKDCSVSRNLIHFLFLSLVYQRMGEDHFSYRVVIKQSYLNITRQRRRLIVLRWTSSFLKGTGIMRIVKVSWKDSVWLAKELISSIQTLPPTFLV